MDAADGAIQNILLQDDVYPLLEEVGYQGTDETYTDAELARVSVLTLDVTKTAYVSPVAKRLASVMKNFNKKIDRKNLNFVNKTAI